MLSRARSVGYRYDLLASSFATSVADLRRESNLVVVGDYHNDIASKKLLSCSIAYLKEKGFSRIYFEMLPQNMQPVLDSFMMGCKDSGVVIKDYLGNNWHHYTPGLSDSFFDIINNARISGISVVAIDEDGGLEQRNDKWAKMIEGSQKKYNNTPAIVFGGAYHIGEINNKTTEAECSAHDPLGVDGRLKAPYIILKLPDPVRISAGFTI